MLQHSCTDYIDSAISVQLWICTLEPGLHVVAGSFSFKLTCSQLHRPLCDKQDLDNPLCIDSTHKLISKLAGVDVRLFITFTNCMHEACNNTAVCVTSAVLGMAASNLCINTDDRHCRHPIPGRISLKPRQVMHGLQLCSWQAAFVAAPVPACSCIEVVC